MRPGGVARAGRFWPAPGTGSRTVPRPRAAVFPDLVGKLQRIAIAVNAPELGHIGMARVPLRPSPRPPPGRPAHRERHASTGDRRPDDVLAGPAVAEPHASATRADPAGSPVS